MEGQGRRRSRCALTGQPTAIDAKLARLTAAPARPAPGIPTSRLRDTVLCLTFDLDAFTFLSCQLLI